MPRMRLNEVSDTEVGSLSHALVAHTLDGRILFANDAFAEQVGVPLAEITAVPPYGWCAGVSPSDLERTRARLVADGHVVFQRPRVGAGQSAGPFRVESWLMEMDGQPVVVSISRNMREEHAKATALRFRSMLLDEVSDAVICHTVEGRMVYVNEVACRQRGFTCEQMMDLSLDELVSDDARARTAELVEMILREGHAVFESEDVRFDGTIFPVEVNARAVDLDGEQVIISIVRDVTERKRAQAEIERLAFFDTLTGLPNRRLFIDRLKVALASAHRSGELVAVIFLDLDHLKRVNDQLGHGAGDRLLALVAQRLSQSVRGSDTVARLGGDEFVVLVTACADQAAAEFVAKKILGVMRQPFDVDGHSVFVTASIGVAVNGPRGATAEEMLAHADAAMYRVKEAARDDYRLYSREIGEVGTGDGDLLEDLEAAIAAGQLLLHYQPQVRPTDGAVTCVEALVRWAHPDRGVLLPGSFIDLAEESGLIVPLGEWVLRTACAQHRAWIDAGLPPVRIAVNLSYRQMAQPNLPHMVTAVLAECGMSPSSLELEMAEADVMRATATMRRSLDALHEQGVRLVIDDFGRGFAAGSHLHGLPVDALKINRCMEPGASESIGGVVAASVLDLARGLSIETVIECVESADQLEPFRDAACEGIQGYVFSRPVPAEELTAVLRDGFDVSMEPAQE